MQEKINFKFYKELVFPVFCGLGAFVLLLALSQTDEVGGGGGTMTMNLKIFQIAISGKIKCHSIFNR